ncbi:hypothetical protein [Methylotuvimicrobium sp. KM1]|uniref:hypothetical protein n=1 Tax=Methylotuvimicrobium sp. KM1 TaxID=3377707 RepID=UPI00384B31BE
MDRYKKRGPKPILGRPMTALERKQRQLIKRRILLDTAKARDYTPITTLISNSQIKALQQLEAYPDQPANERMNLLIEEAIAQSLQSEIAPDKHTGNLETIYREARQAFAEFQEQQRANA